MMTRRTERAELVALFDDLCALWQRAVRLDESSLSYLLKLSLQELRDRLEADLPMPWSSVAPSSAQDPGTECDASRKI